MGCSKAELLERFTYEEIAEWFVYYQVEPFGQTASNLNAGTLAALVYNQYAKESVDELKFALGDWQIKEKENDPENIAKNVQSLLLGLNKEG